jgi:hypothetical protein
MVKLDPWAVRVLSFPNGLCLRRLYPPRILQDKIKWFLGNEFTPLHYNYPVRRNDLSELYQAWHDCQLSPQSFRYQHCRQPSSVAHCLQKIDICFFRTLHCVLVLIQKHLHTNSVLQLLALPDIPSWVASIRRRPQVTYWSTHSSMFYARVLALLICKHDNKGFEGRQHRRHVTTINAKEVGGKECQGGVRKIN